MQTALKKKGCSGGKPEQPQTALNGANVPCGKLLVKPLYCSIRGLLNKIDRSADERINQAMIDCACFLLIELARIDSGGGL